MSTIVAGRADVATPYSADPVEAARWLAPGCLAAAILLGLALQLTNGFLLSSGLALVTAALALLMLVVALPRPVSWQALDRPVVQGLAVGGLLAHEYALLTASPGVYVNAGPGALATFHQGVLGLAVLAGLLVASPGSRATRPLMLALVMAHAALGVWVIRHSPDPAIDVHVFQRDAVTALLRGLATGMYSFIGFCGVLSLALPGAGIAGGFGIVIQRSSA